MNNSFTINRTALRAVSLSTAKKDVRYYLNGVYFETGARYTRLVATDGHTVAIHIHELGENEPDNTYQGHGILPIDSIQPILKNRKGAELLTAYYESVTDHPGRVHIQDGSANYALDLVDARYPDYDRTIPRELSGEPAFINGEYLKRAADMQKILYPTAKYKPIQVLCNGESSAIVDINVPGFLYIVMPMRPSTDQTPGEFDISRFVGAEPTAEAA